MNLETVRDKLNLSKKLRSNMIEPTNRSTYIDNDEHKKAASPPPPAYR